MRVAVVPSERKEEWNRFVDSAPDTHSWHEYDWALVVQRHRRVDYYPLAALDDDGTIRGILPLYRLRTARTGTALVSIPYVVAGGVATQDPAIVKLLLAHAIELAGKTSARTIVLKQYGKQIEDESLTVDDHYYNRELSLAQPVSEIWNQIDEQNKKCVEEAEGRMPELEFPCTDVSTFFRLLLRHEHALGRPCVGRGWVESLVGTGMYEVALLRASGRIAAGTLVKRHKRAVSFPLTFVADDEPTLGYSLYWKLIEQLAETDLEIFHSGRIPNDDAVPAYRLGWGGTPSRYYYYYWGGGQTESSVKRGSGRGRAERLWRRTPLPIARLVGPAVMKQFP